MDRVTESCGADIYVGEPAFMPACLSREQKPVGKPARRQECFPARQRATKGMKRGVIGRRRGRAAIGSVEAVDFDPGPRGETIIELLVKLEQEAREGD